MCDSTLPEKEITLKGAKQGAFWETESLESLVLTFDESLHDDTALRGGA